MLHDAQTEPSTRPIRIWQWSLDDIARMKLDGSGWSQIFRQLKEGGLLAEQTLGHLIARWTRYGDRPNAVTSATPDLRVVSRIAPSRVPSQIA